MRRSIPPLLRLSAKASPCPTTTDSCSMVSRVSYEHGRRSSLRASDLRPGGMAVLGIVADVWSASGFSMFYFWWATVDSDVYFAIIRPTVLSVGEG